MASKHEVWVLGHPIRLLETDASYGMVEVTSLPGVPGPPPHFHKTESEFFFIVRGSLDVCIDGNWQRAGSGRFLELPPNTTHTFINNTTEPVVWLTGWRPKALSDFSAILACRATTAMRRRSPLPTPCCSG